MIHQKKNRGHRTSKIVKSRKSYCNGHLSYQLFLSGYGYRPHVSGEYDKKKNKSALQSGKNISATNPITCGRVNPDIFLSDDVKSVSSLSLNKKTIWRHNGEGEQSNSRHYLTLRRML